MATLAELRSRLRVLLNDNAAEGYLWSDAALTLHLNDAIRDYGRSLPRQMELSITTVAGQGEYDLPVDCLVVTQIGVADTTGQCDWQSPLQENGAGYGVYGGRLILSPTPTEAGVPLRVRYLAPHAALVDEGDLSTVPAADEELLLAFACAEALQGLSMEEAKRQRLDGQVGQAAKATAALYRQQYERGIRSRAARVREGRLVATS